MIPRENSAIPGIVLGHNSTRQLLLILRDFTYSSLVFYCWLLFLFSLFILREESSEKGGKNINHKIINNTQCGKNFWYCIMWEMQDFTWKGFCSEFICHLGMIFWCCIRVLDLNVERNDFNNLVYLVYKEDYNIPFKFNSFEA